MGRVRVTKCPLRLIIGYEYRNRGKTLVELLECGHARSHWDLEGSLDDWDAYHPPVRRRCRDCGEPPPPPRLFARSPA